MSAELDEESLRLIQKVKSIPICKRHYWKRGSVRGWVTCVRCHLTVERRRMRDRVERHWN